VPGRWRGRTGTLIRAFNAVGPALEQRLGQLERDRRLLQAVLEGMTEGVMAVDARRRLLFANRAALRFFNLEPGLDGRLVAEVVRSPRLQAAVEATLHSAAPHREEITVTVRPPDRPRGVELVLNIHGTRIPGEPVPGAVLVIHDITELRRLERMRQDFVANASHELKTPLGAIRAYTETLLDGAVHDDEVNLAFLRRIDEQADRLSQLILDMLALARLDSGDEAFRHEPLAVAPQVRAIAAGHRARAEGLGHQFVVRVQLPDDGVMVRADEEALRQILDNLIDNAIKYTPEPGRVTVACRASDEVVVLEVADTGLGIPREELPRVFERFYRVDKARSRDVGGTGLGLAIVKHLVLGLRGQIHVESRLKAGSLFRVTRPRYRPNEPLPLFDRPPAEATANSPPALH
jgi:two-component system phosphate regulon sensor histidine kinase PhoR